MSKGSTTEASSLKPKKKVGRPKVHSQDPLYSTVTITLTGTRLQRIKKLAPYVRISIIVNNAIDAAYQLFKTGKLNAPSKRHNAAVKDIQARLAKLTKEESYTVELLPSKKVFTVKIYGDRIQKLLELRAMNIVTRIAERMIDAAYVHHIERVEADEFAEVVLPYAGLAGFLSLGSPIVTVVTHAE